MSKPSELQAIDPTALNAVTGGAVTSGSGSSDALTQALSTIVQSLQQLQSNQSKSGFGNPETMMLFMMLMQQRNQPTAVAAAPAPYGWPQLPVGYY